MSTSTEYPHFSRQGTTGMALLALTVAAVLFATCSKDEAPVAAPVAPPDTTTTSNEYTWRMLAEYDDPTILLDLLVISDTEIWICGMFNFDTTWDIGFNGKLIYPYNLARWNGKEMIHYRITRNDITGVVPYLNGMWKTANNILWCSVSDGLYSTRNGTVITRYTTTTTVGDHVRGDERKLYIFGNPGSYTTYQPYSFTRVPFPESDWVTRVCQRGDTIYCTLRNEFTPPNTQNALVIEKGVPRVWRGFPWGSRNSGVWADERGGVYFCGGGVGKYAAGTYSETLKPVGRHLAAIHGTSWNNIWTVGVTGSVFHYNGRSWFDLSPEVGFPGYFFQYVQATANTVCAMGIGPTTSPVILGVRK
jgi:hypothetical protein